jgi:hypothetical protein
MTYQFELDPDHKILLLRFQGRLTDAMMSELYWLIRQHSTATDAQAGIWDCSAVTDFGVSPEFIRQLVDRGPAMPDPTRRPRFFVARRRSDFRSCICLRSRRSTATRC